MIPQNELVHWCGSLVSPASPVPPRITFTPAHRPVLRRLAFKVLGSQDPRHLFSAYVDPEGAYISPKIQGRPSYNRSPRVSAGIGIGLLKPGPWCARAEAQIGQRALKMSASFSILAGRPTEPCPCIFETSVRACFGCVQPISLVLPFLSLHLVGHSSSPSVVPPLLVPQPKPHRTPRWRCLPAHLRGALPLSHGRALAHPALDP